MTSSSIISEYNFHRLTHFGVKRTILFGDDVHENVTARI